MILRAGIRLPVFLLIIVFSNPLMALKRVKFTFKSICLFFLIFPLLKTCILSGDSHIRVNIFQITIIVATPATVHHLGFSNERCLGLLGCFFKSLVGLLVWASAEWRREGCWGVITNPQPVSDFSETGWSRLWSCQIQIQLYCHCAEYRQTICGWRSKPKCKRAVRVQFEYDCHIVQYKYSIV